MEYFNEESYDWRLSNCCQFHNKALANKYNFNTCTRTYALAEGGKEKVLTRLNKEIEKKEGFFQFLQENLLSDISS